MGNIENTSEEAQKETKCRIQEKDERERKEEGGKPEFELELLKVGNTPTRGERTGKPDETNCPCLCTDVFQRDDSLNRCICPFSRSSPRSLSLPSPPHTHTNTLEHTHAHVYTHVHKHARAHTRTKHEHIDSGTNTPTCKGTLWRQSDKALAAKRQRRSQNMRRPNFSTQAQTGGGCRRRCVTLDAHTPQERVLPSVSARSKLNYDTKRRERNGHRVPAGYGVRADVAA